MIKGKIKDNKTIIYIIAFILVAISGFLYKYFCSQDYSGIAHDGEESSESANICETAIDVEVSESFEYTEVLHIYICGSVNNPGVYELDSGSLLIDAVNLAGGLTDNAAVNFINLVRTFEENTSVYIPTNDEVNNGIYSSEYIMVDSDSSDIRIGSVIIPEDSDTLININTASRAELMSVPGIGEVTADSIINYRNSNGYFNSIEELMNIDGIGEGKFNKFREYICV